MSTLVQNYSAIDIHQTVRKKIKIARWLTQKIAEYDVSNDFWTMQPAET